MNRSSPFGWWAWSAWCLVAIACSSTTALPPGIPDCQGGKDAHCSVQTGAGGAASAGGTGGAEDSGTTTTTTTTTGQCGNAGTLLGATSPACEPCIETGLGSATGANCCPSDLACSMNTACESILDCIMLSCTAGNGSCIETCINMSMSTSGAADFMDFTGCTLLNCSSCPVLTPTVSEQ
jgi:hypothetical protein